MLIDTRRTPQTKVNLMEELKKIARVVGRELPGAPHETWLVLDANTRTERAQSGKSIRRCRSFHRRGACEILDSTAKGGVIIAIAERLKVPVRFVGLGEDIEDLREFDAREFVGALFEGDGEGASGSYAA